MNKELANAMLDYISDADATISALRGQVEAFEKSASERPSFELDGELIQKAAEACVSAGLVQGTVEALAERFSADPNAALAILSKTASNEKTARSESAPVTLGAGVDRSYGKKVINSNAPAKGEADVAFLRKLGIR